MRSRHPIPCLILALVLAGAAGEPPVPVRVQTVAFSEIASRTTLSGTIGARIQSDLAFRVGGKIVARPVEVGDRVAAGQELARLDSEDLRFAQEAAAAALEAARADAANADIELRRYDSLGRASPAFLASEYDKRLAAMRATAARVTQAQRQLELATNQRAYGALHADSDGIITALPVQVGQVVAAGQTVATVALTNELEVSVDVPENRISAIRAGDDVPIKLWAHPGLQLRGRIREIGALAQPATRTFMVKVTIVDPPPGVAALGMTAILGFGTAHSLVAALPASALADEEGKPAVYVVDGSGNAALRPVTLDGYGSDGSVLVAAGLQPGETAITAGIHHLRPGLPVTAWAGPAR